MIAVDDNFSSKKDSGLDLELVKSKLRNYEILLRELNKSGGQAQTTEQSTDSTTSNNQAENRNVDK
jgi:hypothetical protein